MFLTIPLLQIEKNLEKNQKTNIFTERVKNDLLLIVQQMKKENIELLDWKINEIMDLKESKEKIVYCLNKKTQKKEEQVDIIIDDTQNIEPHYFNFLSMTHYKAKKAKTIKKAIKLYKINNEQYIKHLKENRC